MIIPNKEQTSAAVAEHYDDLDRFYRERSMRYGLLVARE
jgi:hypothetical protein